MALLPYIETDPDLLKLQAWIRATYTPGQVYMLTDTHTLEHCWPLVHTLLPELHTQQLITIPAGEENKNEVSLFAVLEKLAACKAGRDTVLLNIGGGMITDLGGFAASIYKRGIAHVHIPTSLLAQVDAAIGGKNGIDFMHYKNILGSITEPQKVFISKKFLDTLPGKELRSAVAECFKHALISGKDEWESIKKDPLKNIDVLIGQSLNIKSSVVEKDPYEKNLRKILNAGHTIGHAIETWKLEAGTPILHGEAVAAGLIIESHIAYSKGLMKKEMLEEISFYILSFHGKTDIKKYELDRLLAFMQQDKKNRGGMISFSLVKEPGAVLTDETAGEKIIDQALQFYLDQEI